MTIVLHNIKRLLVFVTITVAVAVGASAQTDAAFSHFWVGPGYYNPAAAGEHSAIHINLGSRMQWVDIRHAPMNFFITVDMPYKLMGQRFGAGVKAEYERIGLFSNTRIGAQIAWKRRFGKNTLSVGVQPGVFSQTFLGHERILPDDGEIESNDEAVPNIDVSGTAFDANVGVFFSNPRFWAGVAVTHITAPEIELKQSRESLDIYAFDVSRGYYFMGGGNIPINNNRMLNVGVGYRWKDAVTAFIGVNLKDAYIGYAYDYPVSAISKATFGSHEVFVTYKVNSPEVWEKVKSGDLVGYSIEVYTDSELVKAGKEETFDEWVESFLDEKCKVSDSGKVSKVALYAAYVAFCKANALKPEGRNTFYDKVRNYDSSITDGRAPDSTGNSVHAFNGISLIVRNHQVTDENTKRKNIIHIPGR